jgi:hypothetical protein
MPDRSARRTDAEHERATTANEWNECRTHASSCDHRLACVRCLLSVRCRGFPPAPCTLHAARCTLQAFHSTPTPVRGMRMHRTPRHAAALPTRLGQAWNQPSGMPDESWTMTHRAPNRSTTTAHNRGAWRRGGARGGGSNHHKPLEWLSHTSLCKRTRCIHSPVY